MPSAAENDPRTATPDREALVAELVESALDLDPAERAKFLERACGQDAALRAEIESLLQFQARAEGFIERPAYQMAAETLATESQLQPGEVLGDYTIRSLIGEGGMGEVYLAHDGELERAVAIKLIKRVFGRDSFLRQFRREERILAGLTHPNIARLYGGAFTQGGLPYFVMEHVDGSRLDEYCEFHQLGLRDRLILFRKICAAVSYAHQHLVIHRDLKPGNIRVTTEGEPKLLDFGIAKLIDDERAESSGETISLNSVMTPEYASPEQVRGEHMSTTSDVYSLGVILYELLTGEKPFRLTSLRPGEVLRTITETEPVRPSAIVPAKSKRQNPKSLRGDLDKIVLMAIRKEPERRYASVALLSTDLERYLAGRPVTARRDTWGYRSARFVQRNKVGVAAAALLLVAILAGILATTWQAQRADRQRALAERRFSDLRGLARSLMFEIHDSVADLPGSTPTRQLIVTRALEYLNGLAQEAGNDPSLSRELASAYIKVGNVQGNPNNSNLGDTSGALESYRKARTIANRLLAANPDDARAYRSLGVIEEKMSDVQAAMGDLIAAVENAQRSLAIFQTIAKQNPGDVAAQQSLAISSLKTGDVLGNPNFPNNGNAAGAQGNYEAALRILQSLPPPTEAGDYKTGRLIGMLEERLGTMAEAANDTPGAEKHYAASQAIRLQLAEQHPENTDVVRDAAIAYEKMGNVLAQAGNLEGALESRRRSLEIFNRLAEADPRNVLAQRSVAISHLHLADLLGKPGGPSLGRTAEAIGHYQQAEAIFRQQGDSTDPQTRENLRTIRETLMQLRAPTQE